MPELVTYPSLEAEFVKATKDLLDHSIFQLIEDSKQGTSTRVNVFIVVFLPLFSLLIYDGYTDTYIGP